MHAHVRHTKLQQYVSWRRSGAVITKTVHLVDIRRATSVIVAQTSDESVWDFEFGFGIGIFRPKYRGIGIGIKIGMKSVSESVSNWHRSEILCNLLPAAVSITLQSNPTSVGSRYLTI